MTRASRPGTNHKKNGGTLTVVGFLCQTWAVWLHGLSIETRIVLGLLGLLMSCSGAFLFWRGCQYDAKADTERIITDHNPHVLYLRAFLSDSSTRKFILSTAFMAFPQATLEEQLADVVRPLGDLVAIGRPGEGLPEPGAARMYASDEECSRTSWHLVLFWGHESSPDPKQRRQQTISTFSHFPAAHMML